MLLVLLLLLVGLIGYLSLQEAEKLQSIALMDAQHRSRDVASGIDGLLASTHVMLSSLAAQPALKGQNAEAVTPMLAELLRANPQYGNLWAARGDGWNYASALPPPDGEHLYTGDRLYFQRAMQTGEMAIQSVPDNRQKPAKFAVVTAYPVRDADGKVNGIVAASFELLPLGDILQPMDLPAGAVFTVFDENGYVVARSVDAKDWVGQNIATTPLWKAMQAQDTGILEGALVGTGMQIAGYTSAGRAPWKVLVGIPSSTVYSQLWGDLLHEFALLGIPALAVAYLAIRLGRTAIEKSEAEEKLRSIAEKSSDGISLVDEHGMIIEWNRGKEEITGLTRGQVLGKPIWEVMFQLAPEENRTPTELERLKVGITTFLSTGQAGWLNQPIQRQVQRPDGTRRVVEMVSFPVKTNLGYMSGSITRDITDRKQTEEERERLLDELRETNQQLVVSSLREQELKEQSERQVTHMSALLESLREAVIVVDGTGRIVLRNQVAEQITGLTAEEATPAIESGAVRFLRLDGTTLPTEERPTRRALRGEQITDVELILVRPDGSRRQVVYSSGVVLDEVGKVTLAIIVFRDITKLRELEQARQDFIHIVSHDLRAPLAIIQGHAQVLQRRLQKVDQPGRELANTQAIITGVRRMNSLIQDLVDSARMETGQLRVEKQPLSLVAFMFDLLQRATEVMDVGRINVEIPADLPPVLADPSRLERAMLNLLTNALKYSNSESEVLVRAAVTSREAIISVADHGPGISPEDLPRIFERFYRAGDAQEKAEGLGLGLYITRMLVEAHGGHIWARSERGKGSTFHFTLPLA